MFRLIIKRLLATVPVVLVVMVVTFAVLRLTPGDPAAVLAGNSATVAQIEQIREEMGLNKPIPVQFWIWIDGIAHGDFGTSLISNLPISRIISDRFGPTLAVTIYTILYTILLSLPAGIMAAAKRGKLVDRGIMVAASIGFSVPVFVTAYVLILIFAVWFQWLPTQGYEPLSAGLIPHLTHVILPVASLSTIYAALITRFVRSSVIESYSEDYIRTARAKGMKQSRVLMKHALPNALIPIVTIVGVAITMLMGGVVVTESVFNIPGLGRLVVEAIQAKDYPVIQAVVVLFAVVDILVNMVIDIVYIVIDPRLRQAR